jgi:hypothetical protein
VRAIKAPAGENLAVVFSLATLRQGPDRLYRYTDVGDGYCISLSAPSNPEAAAIRIAGHEGRITVNGEDTGAVMPLLRWCSFKLIVDADKHTCTLFLNGRSVHAGPLADTAAEGFTGVSYQLPDEPDAHVGLWIASFAACCDTAGAPDTESSLPTDPVFGPAMPLGEAVFAGLTPGTTQATGTIGARLEHAIYRNFIELNIEGDFIRPIAESFTADDPSREMLHGKFVGIGMLLEAAVRMAFYTRDPDVIARKERLVEGLMAAQHADGYLGGFPRWKNEEQLFTEFCFHDAAYILEGLVRDHLVFGSRGSLRTATRLADYILRNWHRRPPTPDVTTLGIHEAFLLLHRATGDRKYLDFIRDEPCGKQRVIQHASLLEWDQEIWQGGHPQRNRPDGGEAAERHAIVHVYRLYERCMIQLIVNTIAPDVRLQAMPAKVLALLADADATGMLITGTSGIDEGWEDTQRGTGRVGETCTTVYALWLFQEVLKATGEIRYGDYMERIIYNGLFAAQEPEGRRLRYFTPPSGKREYYRRDSYCCPNNFRKGMIRLPDHIYYAWRQGFAVNLFEGSEADIEVAGGTTVHVTQSTDYPGAGVSTITIGGLSEPQEFPVRVRIPAWCRNATVEVNGNESGPLINRRWRDGDTIRIHLPMDWRFVGGRCRQQGRAAVMRGPVVYCLSRAINELPEDMVLRDITLDAASVETAGTDQRGVLNKPMCRISGWSPGNDTAGPPDLSLLFHEFAEPTGEEIYFKVKNTQAVEADELFAASVATKRRAGSTKGDGTP